MSAMILNYNYQSVWKKQSLEWFKMKSILEACKHKICYWFKLVNKMSDPKSSGMQKMGNYNNELLLGGNRGKKN